VYTVKDRCRVCYTCVRECPAKAIRVTSGQAEIIPERCICCGNCVTVCSQNAKRFRGALEEVEQILASGSRTAAIVAPSFPAEFNDIPDYRIMVSMIRSLGFNYVSEVAFGADLVADRYKKVLGDVNPDIFTIAANCPAAVNFIEHYHPSLVPNIGKIVSPMIAMARVMRAEYGDDLKIVFIGPCIAKKDEIDDPQVIGEVQKALTFIELREAFRGHSITPESVGPTEFDPPLGGRGAIFPVTRGMLQTIRMNVDISSTNIIVAEGRQELTEALREFETGVLKNHHLELLCCQGCIMGPGMSEDAKRFVRRTNVADYVKSKLPALDTELWEKYMEKYKDLDLSREYIEDDQRIAVPSDVKITEVLKKMGKENDEDMLDCGACGYETCLLHAIAIVKGLAESEMCLPNTIEKLHRSIEELESTKAALKHSEKLASMGQLAAGIAHEVNNPLGVVLLYSNLLVDEIDKNSQVYQDVVMISEQAERCRNIVGGLLNFARKNDVNYVNANVEDLVNSVIKSVIVPENVEMIVINSSRLAEAELDVEQIKQVMINLVKNAIEAIDSSKGKVVVNIAGNEKDLIIKVIDNGPGIPQENMDKLFVPFFTTKPAGKGTGLGLPVSYGIVKMHKGQISVISNCNPSKGETGTTFVITLPRKRPQYS
ncbi:MAG TPA: [Fe-Fe] hydrogenase large subunit C-terminal domain-containing protein, partial [bacterium]|nr:[Fe-Fe] hydrogenase large subunit C-terminal domain-containing protein [bacterium]